MVTTVILVVWVVLKQSLRPLHTLVILDIKQFCLFINALHFLLHLLSLYQSRPQTIRSLLLTLLSHRLLTICILSLVPKSALVSWLLLCILLESAQDKIILVIAESVTGWLAFLQVRVVHAARLVA